MTAQGSRGDLLLHPLVVVTLVVWAVNDHVLKEAWPGLVTGKLSDAAGVVVAPVILIGIYELRPGGRRAGPTVVVGCAAAVAVAFAMVEILPAAAGVYEQTMGFARWPYDLASGLASGDGVAGPVRVQLWQDAPDLLTLPLLFVPLLLGLRVSTSAPPVTEERASSEADEVRVSSAEGHSTAVGSPRLVNDPN